MNIDTSSFNEIKKYYDEILNIDKSTYKSSNDETTPIDCIIEMIGKIPEDLWRRTELSWRKVITAIAKYLLGWQGPWADQPPAGKSPANCCR